MFCVFIRVEFCFKSRLYRAFAGSNVEVKSWAFSECLFIFNVPPPRLLRWFSPLFSYMAPATSSLIEWIDNTVTALSVITCYKLYYPTCQRGVTSRHCYVSRGHPVKIECSGSSITFPWTSRQRSCYIFFRIWSRIDLLPGARQILRSPPFSITPNSWRATRHFMLVIGILTGKSIIDYYWSSSDIAWWYQLMISSKMLIESLWSVQSLTGCRTGCFSQLLRCVAKTEAQYDVECEIDAPLIINEKTYIYSPLEDIRLSYLQVSSKEIFYHGQIGNNHNKQSTAINTSMKNFIGE